MPAPRPLQDEPNLGPKSAAWLEDAGFATLAQVRRAGVVPACVAVRLAGYPANALLAYALWGALNGRHWRDVPDPVKTSLRAGLAAALASARGA